MNKIKNEKDFLQFLISIADENHVVDLNQAVKESWLPPKKSIDYLNHFGLQGYFCHYDDCHVVIIKC